jgi:predicted GNAT family acetyltransferase
MVNENIPPTLLTSFGARKKRLLQMAHMALDETQFEIYKQFLFEELGRSGFERELEEAFLDQKRNDTSGKNHAGKEVS